MLYSTFIIRTPTPTLCHPPTHPPTHSATQAYPCVVARGGLALWELGRTDGAAKELHQGLRDLSLTRYQHNLVMMIYAVCNDIIQYLCTFGLAE